MADTPFARLAQLGEQLERTSKRRELAALLADFLESLSPEETPAAVRLTIGQVFPEWDGRTLNVSWKAVIKVVDGLTDAPPDVHDAGAGEYLVVGKTFKGLTDAEFQAMTERLLTLERSRKGGTVFVQPEVVVQVLFNEIQESSQYKSGLALRFARISRLREDKTPAEADAIQTLRRLYDQQFQYKGRLA